MGRALKIFMQIFFLITNLKSKNSLNQNKKFLKLSILIFPQMKLMTFQNFKIQLSLLINSFIKRFKLGLRSLILKEMLLILFLRPQLS